jgi:hypothetical protein
MKRLCQVLLLAAPLSFAREVAADPQATAPRAWAVDRYGETRDVDGVEQGFAWIEKSVAEPPVAVCVVGDTCHRVDQARTCTKDDALLHCTPGSLLLHLGPPVEPLPPEPIPCTPPATPDRTPGGVWTCEAPKGPDSSPPRDASPAPGPRPAPSEARPPRQWQLEFALSGGGGLLVPRGYIYGGGPSLSVRHLGEFDASPMVPTNDPGGVLIGVFTAGITAVPQGIWLGNERGFELRARLFASGPWGTSPEPRVALGLAPSFRITRKASRLRYPAVISCVLPELGAGFAQGRAGEVLLGWHPFTMGFLLSEHVALELEPTWQLAVPVDEKPVRGWFFGALSLSIR